MFAALCCSLFLLWSAPSAASNFCEVGGKKYSINSTRCDKGKKLRCVAKNEWKEIGTCKEAAPKKGPQFCKHGGKQYSIHSTRCDNGKKLRCVAADEWKEIGTCKAPAPSAK